MPYFFLGDDLGEKATLDSHSSSMVDANTSLLCQLHSHQQRHRMENQQFDTLVSNSDRTKLFDDQYPKTKKLSLLEIQVGKKMSKNSKNINS